ncbi:MAG TPA: glycosyltransferase [Dictyobacter sp.]|nr:glycosyltransferase [Dictyobacter sp.]
MTVQVLQKTIVQPDVATKQLVETQKLKHIQQYKDWLTKHAKYHRTSDVEQREKQDYQQQSTQVLKVNNREITTFAPFLAELSALQTFTQPQTLTFCLMALTWGISGLIFGLNTVAVTLTMIVILYSVNLALSIIMTLKATQPSAQEQIDDAIVHALKDADWPQYTILCPLYRELAVVPQFVQAIQALDYPTDKLQVLFLTEANDPDTRAAIQALQLPSHFQILTVPDGHPRTKPRACNYGLIHATGNYVVIYDAEDIPDPLQLKKAVLTFANHQTDVACVQAKLNCYNSQQNLLTRWYTADYSMWFDLILPGLQQLGFAVPLGGTSNHFLTSALRILGGWDAYNVTEDCDLGLRLARCHLKTVILNSTTQEEATSLLKNWLRQRSRWIKGYMQTYLVHMRHPLAMLKERRYKDLISLQVVVGNRVGILFLNPLMWAFTLIYILCNSSVVTFYHNVFSTPIFYMSICCLIFGNFFYMYLYLLGCLKKRQYHLMIWTLLIPVHWILSSIAALLACWELLVKPHHWQKTIHGLHLQGTRVIVENPEQVTIRP